MKPIVWTLFLLIFAFTLHADSHSLMLQKGEKIAQLLCDYPKLKAMHFDSSDEAKEKILSQKLCKPLDRRKLDAVALWLASSKKSTPLQEHFDIPKDAKCPICGMFVAKYPRWAALMQDSKGDQLWFDGVKDMMKYYFRHKDEKFDPIRVLDFYTLRPVDAHKAWFVIGSNVYGPMGEELIPFRTREDAQTFMKEHFGKKIVRFDEIREAWLY